MRSVIHRAVIVGKMMILVDDVANGVFAIAAAMHFALPFRAAGIVAQHNKSRIH